MGRCICTHDTSFSSFCIHSRRDATSCSSFLLFTQHQHLDARLARTRQSPCASSPTPSGVPPHANNRFRRNTYTHTQTQTQTHTHTHTHAPAFHLPRPQQPPRSCSTIHNSIHVPHDCTTSISIARRTDRLVKSCFLRVWGCGDKRGLRA